MAIKVVVTIDLPDNVSFEKYISILKSQISNINGLETRIQIKEIDDPISLSKTRVKKIKD